jgi:hypothetical protein
MQVMRKTIIKDKDFHKTMDYAYTMGKDMGLTESQISQLCARTLGMFMAMHNMTLQNEGV